MNREEAARIWPVVKAFSEGKEVQCKDRLIAGWCTDYVPNFDTFFEWRVKPEPRIFWIHKHPMHDYILFDKEPENMQAGAEVFKVREVTDES